MGCSGCLTNLCQVLRRGEQSPGSPSVSLYPLLLKATSVQVPFTQTPPPTPSWNDRRQNSWQKIPNRGISNSWQVARIWVRSFCGSRVTGRLMFTYLVFFPHTKDLSRVGLESHWVCVEGWVLLEDCRSEHELSKLPLIPLLRPEQYPRCHHTSDQNTRVTDCPRIGSSTHRAEQNSPKGERHACDPEVLQPGHRNPFSVFQFFSFFTLNPASFSKADITCLPWPASDRALPSTDKEESFPKTIQRIFSSLSSIFPPLLTMQCSHS